MTTRTRLSVSLVQIASKFGLDFFTFDWRSFLHFQFHFQTPTIGRIDTLGVILRPEYSKKINITLETMSLLPVIFIVDENIYIHLKMVCQSVMKHTYGNFFFGVLTDKDSTRIAIENFLRTFCDSTKFSVRVLSPLDASYLESIYTCEVRADIKSLNLAQCLTYRYFSDFDKIFIMEPDQIVKKDLMEFWKTMYASDVKIGAVDYKNGSDTLATLSKLYPGETIYTFNCGVMVIDTKFWQENHCEELCIKAFVKQNEMNGTYFNFYAEGAINVALQKFITPLDFALNTCNLGWNINIDYATLENAIILHWNGYQKPWKSDVGFYKEYYTV